MDDNKTKSRDEKESKERALYYMQTLVDVARESFLLLDSNLQVVSANPTFYQNFRVSSKDTVGVFLYELGNGQWNIPELKELLEKILPEKKEIRDYKVTHIFETIGKKTIVLNAKRIDPVQLIILAMEDITVRQELEEKLAKYTKSLEVEVATKTAELQSRVEELEKINKLMIGREIRMSEMKKEMKEEKAKNE